MYESHTASSFLAFFDSSGLWNAVSLEFRSERSTTFVLSHEQSILVESADSLWAGWHCKHRSGFRRHHGRAVARARRDRIKSAGLPVRAVIRFRPAPAMDLWGPPFHVL